MLPEESQLPSQSSSDPPSDPPSFLHTWSNTLQMASGFLSNIPVIVRPNGISWMVSCQGLRKV